MPNLRAKYGQIPSWVQGIMGIPFVQNGTPVWKVNPVAENPTGISPQYIDGPGGKALRLSLPNDQDYYTFTQDQPFPLPLQKLTDSIAINISFRLSEDSDYPGFQVGLLLLDESGQQINADPIYGEVYSDTYIYSEFSSSLLPATFSGGVWYDFGVLLNGSTIFSSGLKPELAKLLITTGGGYIPNPVVFDVSVREIVWHQDVVAATDTSFAAANTTWVTATGLKPKSFYSYNWVYTNYLLPCVLGTAEVRAVIEVEWPSGFSGSRAFRVLRNGTVVGQSPLISPQDTTNPVFQSGEFIFSTDSLLQSSSPVDKSNLAQFASLDQISVQVYQNSGASQNAKVRIKLEGVK